MEKFINKLSSYNLFNYLIPGGVFAVIATQLTQYSFIQPDIITGIFFYYFIGLVISRFGSLIIEPSLKKLSFINFYEYLEFVSASKKDSKIEILSEVNNSYRTFFSAFILIFILKIYELTETHFLIVKYWQDWGFILLFAILFLFSYRKQTNYITKRIESNKEKKIIDDV